MLDINSYDFNTLNTRRKLNVHKTLKSCQGVFLTPSVPLIHVLCPETTVSKNQVSFHYRGNTAKMKLSFKIFSANLDTSKLVGTAYCNTMIIQKWLSCISLALQALSRAVAQRAFYLKASPNCFYLFIYQILSYMVDKLGLRPATLLKKRLWHRCFPMNFVRFLRKPFLTEHLQWLLLYFMPRVSFYMTWKY